MIRRAGEQGYDTGNDMDMMQMGREKQGYDKWNNERGYDTSSS
jgi:hypothetical protein